MPAAERDPTIDRISEMNQRGGRLLSLVDLIDAGTLSPALAARLVLLHAGGASVACGARAGGMGKTTLLAALLAFTPAGVEVVTVDRQTAPPARLRPSGRRRVWLCHELSRGAYYSYLWGEEIAQYFSLADGRRNHLAFTIHADDPGEVASQIAGPRTGHGGGGMDALDVLVFIDGVQTPRGRARRVTALYEKEPRRGGHKAVFRLGGVGAGFERFEEPYPLEKEIEGFLLSLLKRNVRFVEDVRRAFLKDAGPLFP
jgi:hypothetical protein